MKLITRTKAFLIICRWPHGPFEPKRKFVIQLHTVINPKKVQTTSIKKRLLIPRSLARITPHITKKREKELLHRSDKKPTPGVTVRGDHIHEHEWKSVKRKCIVYIADSLNIYQFSFMIKENYKEGNSIISNSMLYLVFLFLLYFGGIWRERRFN